MTIISPTQSSLEIKIIRLCMLLKKLREKTNLLHHDSAIISKRIEVDIHQEIDSMIANYGSRNFKRVAQCFIRTIQDKLKLLETLSDMLPETLQIIKYLREMYKVTHSLMTIQHLSISRSNPNI